MAVPCEARTLNELYMHALNCKACHEYLQPVWASTPCTVWAPAPRAAEKHVCRAMQKAIRALLERGPSLQ